MTGIVKPPRHRVFVLRYWEVRSQRPEPQAVWRFSLEDPRTGQRHGFATLAELVTFLGQEVEPGRQLAVEVGERPARRPWRRRKQPRLSRL
jgi:hypothetical protein